MADTGPRSERITDRGRQLSGFRSGLLASAQRLTASSRPGAAAPGTRTNRICLLLLGLAIGLGSVRDGWAQSAGPQISPSLSGTAEPAPATAEQIERLVTPFAGAPQNVLGIVFDACRYPAQLLEAVQWSQQPEATRGPARETWAPTVRLLAEQAPRTLEYLTQNMSTTAALGSAYQHQPNDVWLAYGRVTTRETEARPAAASAAPAVPSPPVSAPQPRPVAGARPSAPSSVLPEQAGAQPPVQGAAAPLPQPASSATATVVTPSSGTDPMAAALVGGAIGLGAGLLISELANNNNNSWSTPYGRPYPVPVPYAPYARYGGAGAYAATGARYDAGRALQDDRQAAAREMQQSRQSAVAGRQASGQTAAAGRQTSRQTATSTRQQTRRNDVQGAAAQRPTTPPRPASGAERRQLAGGGQNRPSISSPPQRQAQARPISARSAPEWGPARGMGGGVDTSRARGSSAGSAASSGRAGGGGGVRAGGGGGRR